MVFQNFALLPHRTVVENVEYGLSLRRESRKSRREKAQAYLSTVGLAEWAHHYPDTLSGGMRQRVGLARALATDSDILLMDEPFSALDPLIRSELQEELLRLQAQLRKTIVFVTHDFHEATRVGNRIAIMRRGSIVQLGTPQEIVMSPVDDYVSAFARDVDRGSILCVADVMQIDARKTSFSGSTVATVRSDQPLRDLYSLFDCFDEVAVVDRSGVRIGWVTPRDVLKRLSDSEKTTARMLPSRHG
jgi:glycine betaine/proline transport system ATP-binding protein